MANEMTWQLLQTILTLVVEAPLGAFSNVGLTGLRQFRMDLEVYLLADVRAGGLVSLHFTALTTDLGFNFNSRSFVIPEDCPLFVISALINEAAGDTNCDGVMNNQDVAPFVLALIDPTGYATAFPNCNITSADMNHDGLVDGGDVQGF